MSAVIGRVEGAPPVARRGSQAAQVWARFRSDTLALLALGGAVGGALLVFVGPLVLPLDAFGQDLFNKLQTPSTDHWLGTDGLGRDQLSRLILGGRTSMASAFLALGVALGIGLPLGLVAGTLGRWIDSILSRLNDAIMSVPFMLTAITVVAVLGPGLTNAMLAVGIAMSPRYFRITRAATIDVRGETFIEACRSIGCRSRRIMWRHILPHVSSPVVVQISLTLGAAILAEAALSYLGLGASPPDPSWGVLLREAARENLRAPFLIVPPGIAVMLTVLCFSVVGDAWRDALGVGRRWEKQ